VGVSRRCAGPAAPVRRGFSVGRGLVSLLRTRYCKIAVKNIVALDGCVLEELGRLVHCFDGPFEAASTAELLCPVGSGVRMRVDEPVANVYSTTKVFLKPHQAAAKSVVEGRGGVRDGPRKRATYAPGRLAFRDASEAVGA
jgi:hypothetical protein